MTEDIIAQIENDYTHLKKIKFFKMSLLIAFLTTLVIAVLVIIYNNYQNKQEARQIADTKVFLNNSLNYKTSSALKEELMKIVKNSNSKVSELALLRIIQEDLILENKHEEAKNLLYKIAENLSITDDSKKINYSVLTQNYAKYLWLCLNIDNFESLDDSNKKLFSKFLEDLTKHNGAFLDSANLIKSVYFAKIGNLDSAKALLSNLSNGHDINDFVKKYAKILLHNINVNGSIK